VLFGDHGRLYPHFSVLADFNSRNFFAIDTGDDDGGEGDVMYGEEGDDVMLGQQGDDRMWGGSHADDMIGGHNVEGGITAWRRSGFAVKSGPIEPGEAIVLTAAWSAHREAAFAACRYLIEELKHRAPFWKKEKLQDGERWVEAKPSDCEAARRWQAAQQQQ